MSVVLLKVGNFFDKHWYSMSLGSSLTALMVSFLQEHGILILSFSCTALGPFVIKLIMSLGERRQKLEELRHQRRMNEIAEQHAEAELEAYRRTIGQQVEAFQENLNHQNNNTSHGNEK